MTRRPCSYSERRRQTMTPCGKTNSAHTNETLAIPKRSLGSVYKNQRLPSSVSMVGLGCSSFSTFFWRQEESKTDNWSVDRLQRNHPRVQAWIRTVEYAVTTAGITLLDTAPWYGHGTSEVVIGWALEELANRGFSRERLVINTKVGRYEADPEKQFDFSAAATVHSLQRSLERMRCGNYIDVLQLHDPEFSPSLDILMKETIPAMIECQEKGWCKSLGMTGYPLEVQHQILERSFDEFGRNVWDQSLTYGHYNLHDTSLIQKPIGPHSSFANYCVDQSMLILAAAPLSMGLLTHRGPPEWHPASPELKEACQQAAAICRRNDVDISTLALSMALSNPRIPCTILGMACIEEVQFVHAVALRFQRVSPTAPQEEVLKQVLKEEERIAMDLLRDPVNGPFASVWKSGLYRWDGVQQARNFWKQLNDDAIPEWQTVLCRFRAMQI